MGLTACVGAALNVQLCQLVFLAQLVEHPLSEREVVGLNPTWGSFFCMVFWNNVECSEAIGFEIRLRRRFHFRL